MAPASSSAAPTLIVGGAVASEAPWLALSDDDAVPDEGRFTVSQQRFVQDRAALEGLGERVGLRLTSEDDPSELGEGLDGLGVISIAFAKFTDGRGYSTARLLRERLAYRGQLRATGDVLPDQVFYMRRCGFDAFELAPGKRPEHALEALRAFSVTYQGAADDARPLYARAERPA